MSKNAKRALGRPIAGTTKAPAPPAGMGGKMVALNMRKRSYFRFDSRDDFELTIARPYGRLPKELHPDENALVHRLIKAGDLVEGSKPQKATRKKMDKIRPWLMYLRQSRDFQGIRKRVEDLVERGGNVNNSGFAAREVLEMMRDQEIETHARTDVLNLLHRALERVPGTNKPGDEPGTHEVPRVVSERSDVFEEQVPPAAGGGAGGGSRSAREAIARRPSKADIESL